MKKKLKKSDQIYMAQQIHAAVQGDEWKNYSFAETHNYIHNIIVII